MQYLPASAHAIFTCLSTWYNHLPLHMQYLPASAHAIFTCLCTYNIYLPQHQCCGSGSVSISQRYGSGSGSGTGSGSFTKQKSKKNLESCFQTYFWLFIFENDVHVPSKSNKQKNFRIRNSAQHMQYLLYLPLHMQYLPASVHAIFTCLYTCNIYLPLHM